MIDIDALFEGYFRKFIAQNTGKYNDSQLENKVGEIYENFGNTPIKELGNVSPRDYFKRMKDDELVAALKECVNGGVSVSDYLCDELTGRKGCFDGLVSLIDVSNDELSTYCVNTVRFNPRVKEAYPILLSALTDKNCRESLAEVITEVLSDGADCVKDEILNAYGDCVYAQKYLVEILSKCTIDDRVTELLVCEFKNHKKEYSLYAGYLAKYGDDRALGALYESLKGEKLPYLDYKEIQIAIEALGGEVKSEVDYSADKVYKKLH